MGFGSFIGGIGLCILAVLLGFFGIVVLIGLIKLVASNLEVPLGIGSILVALVLFVYGWYLYKSAKPQGTVNVHNQ
jgi:protein-S-isoprenylcysteine O-methyltransferase Ste14